MTEENPIRVGVNGYGVIGKRVADAVRLQPDMELVGVSDVVTIAAKAAHTHSRQDFWIVDLGSSGRPRRAPLRTRVSTLRPRIRQRGRRRRLISGYQFGEGVDTAVTAFGPGDIPRSEDGAE